tara:strand:+ start:1449 stop:1688 length:240 start_codon:yes stop_codon:yes gene_type:complete
MNFKQTNLIPQKTFKTKANMEKAIDNLKKKFAADFVKNTFVRYIVNLNEDGRYYPIFIADNSNHSIVCSFPHEGFCIVG